MGGVAEKSTSWGGKERVWRHTVFLGVYDLESTYARLYQAFGEDAHAYDERPAGRSACAGVLIDDSGATWIPPQADPRRPRVPPWHRDVAGGAAHLGEYTVDGAPTVRRPDVHALQRHRIQRHHGQWRQPSPR